MSKLTAVAIACLVLLAGAVGCDSDSESTTDPVATAQAQLNENLALVSQTLQLFNPFNTPSPASSLLGDVPVCPPPAAEGACNVSGDLSCTPTGPDYVYEFTNCHTEYTQVITISLVVDGSMTYLASQGEGGWPSGMKTVNFDGGAALGSFFYDLTLDGTKDAVIVATVPGGQARCCADLEAEVAECFAMDEGADVCDTVRKDSLSP